MKIVRGRAGQGAGRESAPFGGEGGKVTRRAFSVRSAVALLVVWLVLVAGFAALTVRGAQERAAAELEGRGTALHRLVSQRVAQHDAHLTSLAALIQAADPPPLDAVRQVALAIMKFYPRITSIRVVELGADGTAETRAAVPDGTAAAAPAFAPQIFTQRLGEARAQAPQDASGHYFLGKRVGGSRPLAIILEIDAAQLVEAGDLPPGAVMRLALDGRGLIEWRLGPVRSGPGVSTLDFARRADSQTQPLDFALERRLAVADVVPALPLAGFAALTLAALLALRYVAGQRRAARQSQEAAQRAEERSRLLERETRLAHAARVNSLGELASGIAHELTQPLTALLSQSQAALRLHHAGADPARLTEALDANVREARRAGDILRRMRDYISNRAVRPGAVEPNAVVTDAAALARADLARRGIELQLDLEHPLPLAELDTVELEQVLHNLIRNAADSLDAARTPERRITIRTLDAGEQVVIRVSDTGEGIPAHVMPRLFEPFFTTKQEGMGLGLSLCATLVERVGGTIEAESVPGQGASFVITLPARPALREAAQ